MSFVEATIGELEAQGCFLGIQDGNHGERHPKSSDYVPEGVPFIMASDISSGRVDVASANKLPQSITEKLRVGFCFGGDVLLSHKGSVGYVAIAPEHEPYLMLTPQVTYYRVNPEKVSARFLSYAFREPMFQKRLLSTAGQQGTRGYVGIKAQRQLKVRFCPRSIQDRIVDAIAPYDDLIENNRRRIALLEEAARMLYREWLIHFRFPGHEHVKIIDGLPEGWERRTLADVAEDISYGYTESARHDVEGPRFLRITDIVDGPINWSDVPRCPITEQRLARFALAPNEIVVARTGATTGWARRIGRLPEPAVFASYLVRFRFGRRYRPEIAATFMQSEAYKAFVKGNLGGAAQPNASAQVLGNAPCIIASDAIQAYFVENVTPMFEQIDVLMEQNQKLAQARDLLLPRLMNGEIAV